MQLPQVFAQRVLPAQRLQFAGQLPVAAQHQLSSGPGLDRHQGQLVQVRPLGVSEAGVGKLGQRLTPPQAERFAQCGGRPRRLAVSRQPSPLGHQLPEADDVDIFGADGEGIAGFAGEDRRRPEGAAQLTDLGLQGVGRVGRLPVAPQHVDQPVSADRPPPLQRQQGQQGPLLGAADRHQHAVGYRFELAEQPHLHEATIGPASALRQCRLSSPAQAGGQDHNTSREGRTMIEAQHLTKRYGTTVAVDEASFAVRPGRVTGFLGPNGAGKSTTMRMILGLDTPSSGSVLVNGKPYRDLTDPLRSVGALLDAKAIVGGRSAASHLAWLADSNGIARRRVTEVLGMVGLSDVAGKRIGTFSLGMNQRLGIAAALLGDPETLMFDEPINGLDPDGIVWIRNLMKSLAAQGRTVFLSSHLMSEMAQTADHLLVIARGRIIADASTDEFVNRNSTASVRVRALQPADLAAALTRRGALVERCPDGAMIVTGLDSAAIGAVASADDITLLELAVHGASLEEAFFELTRDETDYHAGQLTGTSQGA